MEQLRIVIADDEPIIRMDLKEMLLEAGHDVAGEAADGLQALYLARELKPDLVIMDVKMPQMDGLTVAEKLAEENIAPVLLLTAFSQRDFIEKAKAAKVYAYLVKPIQEAQLYPAIEIALARYREQQGLSAEVDKLKDNLETRKVVEKAKGILMKKYRLSEDEAFKRMQKQSMQKRTSMKAVAEAIILAEDLNR